MAYHRINLDGESRTETFIAGEALSPGMIGALTGGQLKGATSLAGRVYVAHPQVHQGGNMADQIAKNSSVVAEYIEEGRELAVLCAAGTYTKDTPVTLGDGFMGTNDVDESDHVLGYSQDDIVLSAPGLIRVRMRAFPGLPSVTGVTVTAAGGASTISTAGGTLQLSAVVAPPGANPAVTWTTSEENYATVSETGLVTAKGNGTVIITATSVSNSNADDDITIVITGND